MLIDLFHFMKVQKIHKQTSKAFYYSSLIMQSTQKQVLNAFIISIKGLQQTKFDENMILYQNYSTSDPKMPI